MEFKAFDIAKQNKVLVSKELRSTSRKTRFVKQTHKSIHKTEIIDQFGIKAQKNNMHCIINHSGYLIDG